MLSVKIKDVQVITCLYLSSHFLYILYPYLSLSHIVLSLAISAVIFKPPLITSFREYSEINHYCRHNLFIHFFQINLDCVPAWF